MLAAGVPQGPSYGQAAPSFLASAWRVFDLSLGLMLWSRRTILTVLLAAGPLLLAVLLRLAAGFAEPPLRVPGANLTGPTAFGAMVWLFYVRLTVPVLAMLHGASLVADEVDDKTITYLFTRPIRRGSVLAGKYLAYLVCVGLLVLPSVVMLFVLIVPFRGGSLAESFPFLARDVAALGAGLAVYGALFALVGAWFRRPLVIGLIFLFGWEPAALVFPGYLKRFTVMAYVQALVPHRMPAGSGLGILQAASGEGPPLLLSVLALAGILAVCLAAAAWTVERREYVLEQ